MTSETFRAKVALLQSAENMYLKPVIDELRKKDRLRVDLKAQARIKKGGRPLPPDYAPSSIIYKEAAKKLYNTTYRTISAWTLRQQVKVKPGNIEKYFTNKEFRRGEALLRDHAQSNNLYWPGGIDERDIRPNDAGIKTLHKFAVKLGMFLCDEQGNPVKDSNGRVLADTKKISKALDRFMYLRIKSQCGFYLKHDEADKLIDHYSGVYAIVFPVPTEGRKEEIYMLAGLRVQHSSCIQGAEDDTKMARIKANIPNMKSDNFHARYQYRGNMKPLLHDDVVNAKQWSILFHLLTSTIESESLESDYTIPPEDTINLLAQNPSTTNLFTAILASTSQARDASGERIAYSSKALIIKVLDDNKEAAQNFIVEGVMYGSLSEVCQSIPDKRAYEVKKYYNNARKQGISCLMTL